MGFGDKGLCVRPRMKKRRQVIIVNYRNTQNIIIQFVCIDCLTPLLYLNLVPKVAPTAYYYRALIVPQNDSAVLACA